MKPTSKHMGDACEMLVAAELTLAGIPAMKMPDNWPHYDVIAQPPNVYPQRISVKARTLKFGGSDFVRYRNEGDFDWLAIVIIVPFQEEKEYQRQIYLIPRNVFEDRAKRASGSAKHDEWRCTIEQVHDFFSEYQDNFRLSQIGSSNS